MKMHTKTLPSAAPPRMHWGGLEGENYMQLARRASFANTKNWYNHQPPTTNYRRYLHQATPCLMRLPCRTTNN